MLSRGPRGLRQTVSASRWAPLPSCREAPGRVGAAGGRQRRAGRGRWRTAHPGAHTALPSALCSLRGAAPTTPLFAEDRENRFSLRAEFHTSKLAYAGGKRGNPGTQNPTSRKMFSPDIKETGRICRLALPSERSCPWGRHPSFRRDPGREAGSGDRQRERRGAGWWKGGQQGAKHRREEQPWAGARARGHWETASTAPHPV